METNTKKTKGKKRNWIIAVIIIIVIALIGLGITGFLLANAHQETPTIPQTMLPDTSEIDAKFKKNQDDYNQKKAEIEKAHEEMKKETQKIEAEYKNVRESMESPEQHNEKVAEIQEETKNVKKDIDEIADIMAEAASQLE